MKGPLISGTVLTAQMSIRPDGTRYVSSDEPLSPYPETLTERLAYWAEHSPRRVFAAQRGENGAWRAIRYGEMLSMARAIGASLLRRRLGTDRPVVILSDNDLEHLALAMGAMWAGVAYSAVSPAYSLVARDFEKLRHVVQSLTPGLVYVSTPSLFAPAAAAALPADVEIVSAGSGSMDRAVTRWEALLKADPSADEVATHNGVTRDTVVKFLFTSGSTRLPKAVPHTHRMLCSNQQMILQSFPFLADKPPVLVDWLPWNHTFGGNHNLGIVLYNGGTLYIDAGKPTKEGIHATLRNLREISPTFYFNVPKGFDEISRAMENDPPLRESLFRNCRALFFAGAGLAQPVWDRLDQLAERTLGSRIPIFTGLGMTETSPASTFALRPDARSGHIGLPCPGVEVKLAPVNGKLEIRFRGPHVMPGYWRAPELTREVFDEEGFYRTGDAVQFVDQSDLARGLRFDGRIVDDFKLSSGTFVNVDSLRSQILLAGSPYVQDVVLTGADQDEIGMLVFPQIDRCRAIIGADDRTPSHEVLRSEPLRALLQDLLSTLAQRATGTSTRVTRAAWLPEPPSLEKGELTDKGSINQRMVLTHRREQAEALYRAGEPHVVLLPSR